MNPLSPKQILRNLENGFFMTHQEQTEAAEYIRQLQQSNEALKEGLIKNAEEMFNLCKKLAKPEQEPVAYVEKGDLYWCDDTSVYDAEKLDNHVLYTAPPRKEWVGLTDKEIENLMNETGIFGGLTPDEIALAHAIEAKLKEKNT